jgi:hypothetical protein
MEITRTIYSAAQEPVKDQPFQLVAFNLQEAISQAIDYAKQPNSENFNACCLQIHANGKYYINERCYANTSYSCFRSNTPYYNLTVPANGYPAQAWPFSLIEFCGYFGIPVSSREWHNDNGEQLISAWDSPRVIGLQKAVQRALTYMADLNGSPWIKGDGVGEIDMRQRAKCLQDGLYKALHNK